MKKLELTQTIVVDCPQRVSSGSATVSMVVVSIFFPSITDLSKKKK
jgi:hypothetical protein